MEQSLENHAQNDVFYSQRRVLVVRVVLIHGEKPCTVDRT